MSDIPYMNVLLRRNRQTRMLEEYSVGLSEPGKPVWFPISLACEIALEKGRFVPFKDTQKAGWQSKNPADAIEYCLVALYESDAGNGDPDDDDDEDD